MLNISPGVFKRYSPYSGFADASEGILKHLHESYGMNLWMVTRTVGKDWIVLHAEDHGYEVKQGDVFLWSDSFCSRMTLGKGPTVAPNSQEILAYREAPIGQKIDISAYIGVPITRKNGELFGTLCAINPKPMAVQATPNRLAEIESEVACYAKLLSTILEHELMSFEATQQMNLAREQAQKDELTNVYNRRGWDQELASLEQHCRDYGTTAAVIILDIDKLKLTNDQHGHHAGDTLLVAVSNTLTTLLPKQAQIARIGGDEFGILLTDINEKDGLNIAQSLNQELDRNKTNCSIGFSMRKPNDEGLKAAVKRADHAMLASKQTRRNKEAP